MNKYKFSGIKADGKTVIGDLIQISDKHGYIVTYFEKGYCLPGEDLWTCKCVLHKVKMNTVKLLETANSGNLIEDCKYKKEKGQLEGDNRDERDKWFDRDETDDWFHSPDMEDE